MTDAITFGPQGYLAPPLGGADSPASVGTTGQVLKRVAGAGPNGLPASQWADPPAVHTSTFTTVVANAAPTPATSGPAPSALNPPAWSGAVTFSGGKCRASVSCYAQSSGEGQAIVTAQLYYAGGSKTFGDPFTVALGASSQGEQAIAFEAYENAPTAGAQTLFLRLTVSGSAALGAAIGYSGSCGKIIVEDYGA